MRRCDFFVPGLVILAAIGVGVLSIAPLFSGCQWSPPPQPVAKIAGPTHSLPGDLVRLSSEGSVGTCSAWSISPESAASNYFPLADGVVFATRKEGMFVFTYATASGDEIAMASHSLHNFEGPDPDPPEPAPPDPTPPDPDPEPEPDPDPPEPLPELSQFVYDSYLDDVRVRHRGEYAEKISAVFGSIASRIAAGVLRTPEEIIEITAKENKKAVGFRSRRDFMPWFENLADYLNEWAKDGKLSTPDDYALAWEDIAIGLERAAEEADK